MNNRTDKPKRLIDYDLWKFYKSNRKVKKNSITNFNELKLITKEIFKVIAEDMVEKTAGVFIKGLGYFFIWKIPVKRPYAILKKGQKIRVKVQHVYRQLFICSNI